MNTHQRRFDGLAARRLVLGGRVQGVGFRPFVYRTASMRGLSGWVRNETGQVVIHVEGMASHVAEFTIALIENAPPLAQPHLIRADDAAIEGSGNFRILASVMADAPDVHLPPDLFCCDDCMTELQDDSERRYHYAFTNCTQCGPRYTIISALPYDRPKTSMAGFDLCPACSSEYEDPRDRRFHAEPLACPDCGPQLQLRHGDRRFRNNEALAETVTLLRRGSICAVKGVGGYHLMCDAASDDAVRALRARKHRPDKPLAVMFPQTGEDRFAALREAVDLSDVEAGVVADPARPIVLVRRRRDNKLSNALAPGLAELGVFLPYSPLHHLLLNAFGGPLVATSGNISGEPVITDNDEAGSRLSTVAEAFLDHDRPILRPADDSVVRVIAGIARPIRLGRGMAPLEIDLPDALEQPTLAVGGHMKCAIALGWGRRAIVSPHIGELDSPHSLAIFEQVIADLQSLYRVSATRIVCDSHPGYRSSRWAMAQGLPVTPMQHHVAHASALAGERPDIARWLTFTWDGIGLGANGELWGGETFVGSPGAWRRVASLRPFHILGGDRAGRAPWRSAAAVMWECGYDWPAPVPDGVVAAQAWRKRVGTIATSSVGRLFDAAASLVLGIDEVSYEGQGPMMLESIARPTTIAIDLPMARDGDGILRADWAPLLPMLCDSGLVQAERAAIFHESLAQMIVRQAVILARSERFDGVGLAGGVFQNRLLSERVIELLEQMGFAAHLPQNVPVNDGGLAFGQLIEALGLDGATRDA